MLVKKQIIIILSISILLGLIRFIFLNDSEFTLIKTERILKEIDDFNVPDDISGPMVVSLEFSKYHFDNKTAIFIDARDFEDFDNGHIKNSINIPFHNFEEYEELISSLDDSAIYIIYCSGGECSLSIDLADYLYNEKYFEKVLVFEGGWPEWKNAGYP